MDKFLQKNGSIIFSIDTFTVVFENATLGEIFKSLQIGESYLPTYEEILANHFESMAAYGAVFAFGVHQVGFQIKRDDLVRFLSDDYGSLHLDFYNTRLPFVRVDAMGKACDNLRSLGVNVENLCFNALDVPSEVTYHFTRIDFAYDLFDHCPRFIDQCIDLIYKYAEDTFEGKKIVVGPGRPLGVSARLCDQKSIYFGKGSSNKCLRCYDKRMEQERLRSYNAENFKFYPQLKYLPESWIRLELQVRREANCHALLSSQDPLKIFRYIFDNYAIRAGRGREVPVADEWQQLFDWDVIPSIIQNANYIDTYTDPVAQAEKYICNVALSSIMVFCAHHGFSELRKIINDELERWQSDTNFTYKFNRFMLRCFGGKNKPENLLRNTNGFYFID